MGWLIIILYYGMKLINFLFNFWDLIDKRFELFDFSR